MKNVEIHAIVDLEHYVVLKITEQVVDVHLDTLETLMLHALLFRMNLNVVQMAIVQVNMLASMVYAKILVMKLSHVHNLLHAM